MGVERCGKREGVIGKGLYEIMWLEEHICRVMWEFVEKIELSAFRKSWGIVGSPE